MAKKKDFHCVKNFHIWIYFGPYFTEYLSVFSTNAGKCEPE